MRTRILGKMRNSEVQDYLQRNDIIIVPVGTTEMHGGFPLDCETVISEAYAPKMAEACDGLENEKKYPRMHSAWNKNP